MAIGKLDDETDIQPEHVSIHFGDLMMYPEDPSDALLDEASRHLVSDEVLIRIDLGIAAGAFTVYGCDLTEGYVKVNAYYTS
jgi:glutamate N-acetyltransferase/amino-acid N-acetyltransferase